MGEARLLGIQIDQELRWHQHVQQAVQKAEGLLLAVNRLTRPSFSLPEQHVQHLYLSMVLPRLECALPVWYTPMHEDPNTRRWTGSIGHTKIMDKVQRLGCKLIIGAYRSTATDILELHAWIPLTQILLDDICYHEVLRLVTLPSSHPLYKAVQRSSKRHPRSHPSTIHNLLWHYKICPDTIETIDSTRHHPNWHPQFTAHIAESKLVATSILRTRMDDIQIFSDGSGSKGNIGAAAVTLQDGPALPHRLGKDSKHTVLKGKLSALF